MKAETETGDKWHFQLAPYAWLAGQKETIATPPGLPAADVVLDFYDDIADNINGALFLLTDAGLSTYAAKNYYKRSRPFVVN